MNIDHTPVRREIIPLDDLDMFFGDGDDPLEEITRFTSSVDEIVLWGKSGFLYKSVTLSRRDIERICRKNDMIGPDEKIEGFSVTYDGDFVALVREGGYANDTKESIVNAALVLAVAILALVVMFVWMTVV